MIKRLAFWTMFPLVVPQALRVRKTAPRFAGASGHNIGFIGEGDCSKLLAIGDSVVAGVGVGALVNALVGRTAKSIASRFDVSVQWTALGKIGATSGEVTHKLLPRVPAQQYDVIVVSVGVNDVTGLKRSATFEANLRELLAGLHKHSPKAQIAVLGMPPLGCFPLLPQPLRWVIGLRGRTFDQIIERAATEQSGAYYIPVDFKPDPSKFAADGYHPSQFSCKVLGDLIGETLSRVGREPAGEVYGDNVTPLRARRYS